MKVKELINTASITRINIFIIISLFIIFILFCIVMYNSKYNFVIQSEKLKARVTAQQIEFKLKNIMKEYAMINSSYNTIVSNYKQIDIKDRRNKIKSLTTITLKSNKNIKGLSVDFRTPAFDNNLLDTSKIYSLDSHYYCIYANKISTDSIIYKNVIDNDTIKQMFSIYEAPEQMKLIGPYNEVNYADTNKFNKIVTIWQQMIDSNENKIGATYLDILCDNYHKIISETIKEYDCNVFIFKRNSNIFIYHPDFKKIGKQTTEDISFADSLDNIFLESIECSFDAYNNITQENNFIIISSLNVPYSNINLNIAIAFPFSSITSPLTAFTVQLIIILFSVYLIFITLLILFSKYSKDKYSNAEIIFNDIEEKYD